MRIGIHTDNYRLENRSLDYCLDSVAAMGAKICELNVMQGFDLFQGHGFSPKQASLPLYTGWLVAIG